jgi:hypothetical protein
LKNAFLIKKEIFSSYIIGDILRDNRLSLTRRTSRASTKAHIIYIGVEVKISELIIGSRYTCPNKAIATTEGGGRDCE